MNDFMIIYVDPKTIYSDSEISPIAVFGEEQ